jgi:hypothetical protein
MGKYFEREKQEPSMKERDVTSSILSADVIGFTGPHGDGGHCARILVIRHLNCLEDLN